MGNEKMKDVLRWYESIGIDDIIKDNLIGEPINLELVEQNNDPNKKPLKLDTANNSNNNRMIKNQSLSRIMADNAKNLDDLKKSVMNFDNCQLKHTAKNTVFADGTINAPIMLIGEAPGQSEDEQGIPFCGASGKLLDEILKSIGIVRTKNAYITINTPSTRTFCACNSSFLYFICRTNKTLVILFITHFCVNMPFNFIPSIRF